MAESQGAAAPDATTIAALGRSLSTPRLVPYLTRSGNDIQLALKFYLWNARLSKSLLYPLHVAEITIRNSMHNALSLRYGGVDWIFRRPFCLTQESLNAILKSERRLARRRKKQNNTSPIVADDVIAALTFDFWSNLFRFDYEALWLTPGLLREVFPNLPINCGRPDIQRLVATVNDLRNRIAHHEPIYADIHISTVSDDILKLIGWRCTLTKEWVKAHSTVSGVLRARPTTASILPGLPLVSTNLHPPPILSMTDTLFCALPKIASSRPAIALVPESSLVPPYRAITAKEILTFIAVKAEEGDSLVDLSDHMLSDVLENMPAQHIEEININATTGDAIAAFFPRKTREAMRPKVLVVVDDNRCCIGVIAHPEIRY